jgi:uncharacterized membrane protein HdeD (DUF308 family)
MPMTEQPPTSTRGIVALIAAALLAWGLLHAVGAVQLNGNPWRGVVVLGCVALFLGSWLMLLWNRGRRAAPPDRR